jgi:hypothetical protein
MVKIGDALEIEVVRHSGRGHARQGRMQVATVYHDSSVVVWSAEPAFELKKTCIDLKDDEAAWATIVKATSTALKAGS